MNTVISLCPILLPKKPHPETNPNPVVQKKLASSWLGGWRLKEAHSAEVSNDEGHREQGDADPHGRKELVDGIGHHECAGAGCHFGLHQGLFEAKLKQDCRHVDATGGRKRQRKCHRRGLKEEN